MGLATGGDYDDDLGHGYIRRPISVAQLLEREGFSPSSRSKATRRALTGVAAGAVLALGAVVGSLFLNHGATTTGDTLASGQSGGDIVLAESGNHLQSTNPASVPSQSLATAPASTPNVVAQTAPLTKAAQRTTTSSHNDGTISGSWTPSTSAGTKAAAPSTQSAAPVTTQSAPATQSAPSSGASTPATTTAPPTTATNNSSANTQGTDSTSGGGLLGTVTGTLGDVTGSLFNWFGPTG